MRFDVVTLFPKMFETPFGEGIVGQAIKSGKLSLKFWNPRDYTTDAHKSVDDRPFGGGDGMVMLPEILKKVLDDTKKTEDSKKGPGAARRVIYLSPQGPVLTQNKAIELAKNYEQIVFICGRYGGIDERILQSEVDEELSIGDYILSGGELAAMVAIDTISRFMPGVLGNAASPLEETFKDNLLEQPLYTKPREFDGLKVPEVLLSGNHAKIEKWQREQRVLRTVEKRPDLLSKSNATSEEIAEACGRSQISKNVALGLVHYPRLQ